MAFVHPPQTLVLTSPPDVLKQSFLALRETSELASLLEITVKELNSYAYGRRRKYRTFRVKKRRRIGEFRELSEPIGGLKIIQQKLNQILQATYEPRPYVHGFVSGKSVATNAKQHAGRRWVLNIDLADFFHTINFGRVRGILKSRPYALPDSVATVIAQLCCYNGCLPQGAPTSPVISNMVAARLDSKLQKLACRHKCVYTRYADDITLSTDRAVFPTALAMIIDQQWNSPTLGEALLNVIKSNGFEINSNKIRLAHSDQRQEVTGLTVNHSPNVNRGYIRRIRAMLHAWEKFDYHAAEAEFRIRWDAKDRRPSVKPSYKRIVKGYLDFLAMVRGNDDRIYVHLLEKYGSLCAEFRARPIHRRRRNHLQSYRDAIWSVNCWKDANQGTAFELEGVGLVTCAHVVGKTKTWEIATDVTVTQPRAGAKIVRVKVVHFDKVRDVAILEFDSPSGVLLTPKFEPDPDPNKRPRIRAAGFPEHGPGHTIWEDEGNITGYWHHITSPRYIVNVRVAGGASGGPVFDASDAVIGIISHGEDSIERAMQGVKPRFGMIPLRLLAESLESTQDSDPGVLKRLLQMVTNRRRRYRPPRVG
jgi:RNA-directed DNA polymerase